VFYGAAFVFSLALTLFALFDVIATDSSLCRNLPKELWILLVIFLPTMGAVAWLLLGRPEKTRFYPGDTRYRASSRPSRPLGPDDDPKFLGVTGGSTKPSPGAPEKEQEPSEPKVTELRAWEEDLRRREEELRRKQEDGSPGES
jgi:hypothetical protein